MSKIIQETAPQVVQARIVYGEIAPIAFDKLRLFNPKSPARRALGDIMGDLMTNRPGGSRRVNYMAKTAAWSNGLLLLLFNNTNFANVGDATGLRGSSTAGSLYAGLHTSDPGTAGDQTTNEIAYTSYARVAIARSGSGFTVTANSVSPVANITFPAGTGGSGTAAFFSLGTAVSGAGVRLYNGTVTPNIVCGNGVTPALTTATAVTES